MWLVDKEFRVKIGGNTYINVPSILVIKGESLISLKRDESGYLGIYFEIYDASGKHVASVKRNEIYFGDKQAYQIDGSANRYTLTERSTGRVVCDITRREDAHPDELNVSVHLYTPTGFLFDASPEQTNLPGSNVFRGCTFEGGLTAFTIA